ncbi:MAG: Hsp20 family protein [Rhodospirillaceae bacterium]|nr:Hsp20 family protein [Rhodospirillaceae bacterium]
MSRVSILAENSIDGDEDCIEAHSDKGVLRVVLSKHATQEEDKPRRIQVKSG